MCCKATLLPPNAFGPDAPEGSEEFRFRTIALKPAFILSQLKATQLPVVFLDVDLEFHKFPELFMPGSWPDGDRDVALFNYWGNETNVTARRTPNTGSGVAFSRNSIASLTAAGPSLVIRLIFVPVLNRLPSNFGSIGLRCSA